MTETVTFLLATGFPAASFKVTVTVAPDATSTDKLVGETAIVDTVAEGGPENIIETVLVRAMLSVVSVAETVLAPSAEDFIVAVACPLASVADAG